MLSLHIGLIKNSLWPFSSWGFAILNKVFIAALINTLESFVLEDYVDIVISVLEQEECQSCVYSTLSLACRYNPYLRFVDLWVFKGKASSCKLKMVQLHRAFLEYFCRSCGKLLNYSIFSFQVLMSWCNRIKGCNKSRLVLDFNSLLIICGHINPLVQSEIFEPVSLWLVHLWQISCRHYHFSQHIHVEGDFLVVSLCHRCFKDV